VGFGPLAESGGASWAARFALSEGGILGTREAQPGLEAQPTLGPEVLSLLGERHSSESLDPVFARTWAEPGPCLSLKVRGSFSDPRPILVECASSRSGAYMAPFIHLKLEEGAEALLVVRWRESPQGDPRGSYLSPHLSFDLGSGSRLKIFELEELGYCSRFVDSSFARLGKDAELTWDRGVFGGALGAARTEIVLEGQGSRALMNLGYLARSSAVDLSVVQRHQGPSSYSRTVYKGLAEADGRAATHGLIAVESRARGTDAYLSSKGLSLAPSAKIVSLPELAIDTNDLTASHGSAIGSVGPEELFYLATRGIDPEAGKALIAAGLLGEFLDAAPEALGLDTDAYLEALLGPKAAP